MCVMLMIADYTDDNDKRVISDFKVVDTSIKHWNDISGKTNPLIYPEATTRENINYNRRV